MAACFSVECYCIRDGEEQDNCELLSESASGLDMELNCLRGGDKHTTGALNS